MNNDEFVRLLTYLVRTYIQTKEKHYGIVFKQLCMWQQVACFGSSLTSA